MNTSKNTAARAKNSNAAAQANPVVNNSNSKVIKQIDFLAKAVNDLVESPDHAELPFVHFETQLGTFMSMKLDRGPFNVREALDDLLDRHLAPYSKDFDKLLKANEGKLTNVNATAVLIRLFLESVLFEIAFMAAFDKEELDEGATDRWYNCYGLIIWIDMVDARMEENKNLVLTF